MKEEKEDSYYRLAPNLKSSYTRCCECTVHTGFQSLSWKKNLGSPRRHTSRHIYEGFIFILHYIFLYYIIYYLFVYILYYVYIIYVYIIIVSSHVCEGGQHHSWAYVLDWIKRKQLAGYEHPLLFSFWLNAVWSSAPCSCCHISPTTMDCILGLWAKINLFSLKFLFVEVFYQSKEKSN